MKSVRVISVILTLLLCSCSKNKLVELKYTTLEFEDMAHDTTPLSQKGDDAIKFSDYAAGVKVLEAKALVYQRLPFYAIPFEKEEDAKKEAYRLNQYYVRNWLLDRVTGEPILEDYVIKTFHAINPTKKIQRVPKEDTSEHAPEHASENGH